MTITHEALEITLIDLPDGCPPGEATDADGAVFRIVRGPAAVARDMLTHAELDKAHGADECDRRAISVFNSLDHARYRQRMTPRLGAHIARGVLQREHGRVHLNKPASGHISWWPAAGIDRAQPFTEVTPCP